jgi:UDP-glucuronate 4-epimerase
MTSDYFCGEINVSILVTGAAGFIGAALTLRLLERGETVVGLDNHNNYYEPELKEARVARFLNHPNYTHLRIDLANRPSMQKLFDDYRPQKVVNLAAQAGVRYSIENPTAYIDSNIVGFANILEGCRTHQIQHLVYASTSSVYGANTQLPFSVRQNVDHPISLYAATKKSNELMAHSYSHLYDLPTTGLRFFTVYGPWGRPDMALFKFTKSILAGEPITVFNYGKHRRDFTYIDDITEGILKVLDRPPSKNSAWDGVSVDPSTSQSPYRIYNIGNNKPVELLTYITALERALGVVAQKQLLPMQLGDIADTHADISELTRDFDYEPKTDIQTGINQFVCWYKQHYKTKVD